MAIVPVGEADGDGEEGGDDHDDLEWAGDREFVWDVRWDDGFVTILVVVVDDDAGFGVSGAVTGDGGDSVAEGCYATGEVVMGDDAGSVSDCCFCARAVEADVNTCCCDAVNDVHTVRVGVVVESGGAGDELEALW